MRLPRVRFTVRRLMIAVAIVALALGIFAECVRLSRKSASFRTQAEACSGIEETLRMIIAASGPDTPVDVSPGPGMPSRRFTAMVVAEHQAALKLKYERAARRPWLPVEPDPPEPQ
jgi:hypothetical protein